MRDADVHIEVVNKVLSLALENGFSAEGLEFSPVKGPEGNIEYLVYLKKSENPEINPLINPVQLVKDSHEELQ